MRSRVSFLDLCRTPDLAVEVSLQPYRLLGVDAVIMFSDILIPVMAMGVPIDFTEEGPRVSDPIRTETQVAALDVPDPDIETPFVLDIIRKLRRELNGAVPVIGFAGAPWTLATYIVANGKSAGVASAKSMMLHSPDLLHRLLEKLTLSVTGYLNGQIDAGAQVIQLFDTWAGELSPSDYEEFALRYERHVIEGLKRKGIPVILYVNGCAGILERMASSGADVLSIDWRLDLSDARRRVGNRVALQGNLDPQVLLGPRERVFQLARQTVRDGGGAGHILNLGHGILPNTPVENARAFVEATQGLST